MHNSIYNINVYIFIKTAEYKQLVVVVNTAKRIVNDALRSKKPVLRQLY